MRKFLTATLTGLCLTLSATAPGFADGHKKVDHGGSITYAFDGDFDDATFAVESAIIGAGLNIDYTSHVGEMLARTAADVGSDVKLFDNAQYFRILLRCGQPQGDGGQPGQSGVLPLWYLCLGS